MDRHDAAADGEPAMAGSSVEVSGLGRRRHRTLVRVLVVLTVVTGTNYVVWRWLFSVNWDNWWIGVPLVLAETYSLIDALLFGATMWRLRERGPAPPPPPDATVDVFITTYNEPVDMVTRTAVAAREIRYPHRTWILDDGDRPEMERAAKAVGVGYLTRSEDWRDRPRHAKAGNLNNVLFETDGEFLLILDADQVPDPAILDRTLGWCRDEDVALVQTPQWFTNVPQADPLGSQAPLFYGPIQQGKDGWNAPFFCGSNAVVRREALLQIGVVGYVREVEEAVRRALDGADAVLRKAQAKARRQEPAVAEALGGVRAAARQARQELRQGEPVAEVTRRFGAQADEAARQVVASDVAALQADLSALADLAIEQDAEIGELVVDEAALDRMAQRDWSPLGALESVRSLMRAVDVGREDEAQPIMPMATISVTEDMATAMRLHGQGWRTVYHHEVLAHGLAPDDAHTMLQQRLRWSQGDTAGAAAGKPARPARPKLGPAPHVLLHHVELPVRLRGPGLHRCADPLHVLRRPAGEELQRRPVPAPRALPARQPAPVLRDRQGGQDLAGAAVQPGAVPPVDPGRGHRGGERLLRPQPRLRRDAQDTAGRGAAVVAGAAPARRHGPPGHRGRGRRRPPARRTGAAAGRLGQPRVDHLRPRRAQRGRVAVRYRGSGSTA